ncbi:MAG: fasciclin domain-containing protein, partial [Pseudomonadota bacterium]
MTTATSFTIRGLEFVFQGGQVFLGEERVSLLELVLFAGGRIDLEPPAPEPTIVDIVIQASGAEGLDDDNADFDILREALIATDLVGTLADAGADFSVFAPTDAAFIQLAQDLGFDGQDEAGALDFILAALTDLGGSEEAGLQLLADILLYHVAPEGRTLAELNADGTITTALGATLESDGNTLVDAEPDLFDPTVIAPDIQAANGVIQAIDRVLLPLDLDGNTPSESVAAVATAAGGFTILLQALEATGLAGLFDGGEDDLSDVTVFAPTDAAFGALAQDLGFTGDAGDTDAVFAFLVEALTDLGGSAEAGLQLLTDILLYHVSPGAKSASAIAASDEIETLLEGATFSPASGVLVDNEPDVADPAIVVPDLQASNGAIQAIDRVLLPIDLEANNPTQSVAEVATAAGGFTILLQALEVTDLAGLFDGGEDDLSDVTVFAPTDAAFGALAQDLGFTGDPANTDHVFAFLVEALTELGGSAEAGLQLLTDILLYHVSPGAKNAATIAEADEIETLLEGATFSPEDGMLVDNEPEVADPAIIVPDLQSTNGSIQAIDRVLLPLDLEVNDPDQTLTGTFRGDDLTGRGGDDTLVGRGGRDTLDGAGGNDALFGDRGRDKLIGGTGDDELFGGTGRDKLHGGEGHDELFGGFGRDTLDGGAGDDTMHGGFGA